MMYVRDSRTANILIVNILCVFSYYIIMQPIISTILSLQHSIERFELARISLKKLYKIAMLCIFSKT